MSARWYLHYESLAAFIEPVEKGAIAAVELVGCPRRYFDPVAFGSIYQIQSNLRFGLEYNLVGDVVFFRRCGSSAHSLGRYN